MMSLTWYGLGLLTVAAVEFLRQLNRRYRLNGIAWSGLLAGIGALLFCIAWSVGAYLEGVPRAAAMGLLLFGLSGMVILAGIAKYIDARLSRREVSVSAAVPPARARVSKGVAELSVFEQHFWKALARVAYISLIIAFFLGMEGAGKDYETMIHLKFPDVKLTKVNDDPPVFQMGRKVAGMGNYIMIQEGQGYGGPFLIGIRIMDDTKIHEVMLLDNRETPAFVQKIDDARFPEQFVGKSVRDDFIVGQDVDVVTGASVSTRAGTQAIRNGAHLAASQYFKFEPSWRSVPWNIGRGEILVVLLFVLAFVNRVHRAKPWKHLYMVASLAIVGFYMNACISVSNFAGLLQGFIPPLKEHLVWWTLVFGSVVTAALLGKNLYCFRICPFYWVEWLLGKAGGSRLSLSPGLQRRAKYVADFCLWASLMLIFLSGHPGLGNYEPFAMMFSLNGVGVQWYILPLALIGSFFLASFWCRFFCPVGSAFRHLLSWRRKLLEKFKTKAKPAEA